MGQKITKEEYDRLINGRVDPAPLAQAAEVDRAARPWRYYELDRDVLLRMLDEQANQLQALRAALFVPTVKQADGG